MINVTDDASVLSPSARADLAATPTPFAATVVFRDIGKGEMESAIRACGSASPSAVCIGVNPRGHFTTVYYGIDVAGSSAAETIKKAGNPSFKAGDWTQGVRDILVRAEAVSHSRAGATVINQPVTTIEHPVSALPFVIGFGFIGGFILLAYLAIRKQRAAMKAAIENSQRETAEMASRNIRAEAEAEEKASSRSTAPPAPARRQHEAAIPVRRYVPVPPAPPAYSPPVIIDRSGNDFATGLILGQAISQPRVIEREVIRETPRYRTPDPDPAPSSSWSSNDSSSSSDDSSSGGGSSDFNDSGGGGGSSDW
ncbi:MAG: hypothetical protein EPN98_21355 [Phenylobacterium sp.]|uniref:hypothetical protein n=1 Tax=Phenylobacterium sp. TaxID=1871053 RepID=UPI00120F7EDF|nr:hypothetical protein [Phenylobacterium sp.]TAL28992.1 MAG: hypothetical protein EPN98_21355 [Phenylobacterium sp.]